ncbi:MAG TPA: bifunctional demethylmenaquinone methyltransferase/2-methoxy-6-polyprenyl-1,4-benzoquinol methylase UbiE [Flavisolibacter sp.]|nr:bifunctional demethylmenaquinone methyltransferase/2-methoxy-6-polyprenyl-1,4-benzoquinol methylase UbiE [Flavisolibacter sp.]
MTKFAHDDIKPFAGETGKKEQVAGMFDSLAPRYDLVNRVLSVGIDRGWRKKAIRELQKDAPQHILDVATGTADMALLTARLLQPAKITGIDISEGMLEVGRQKIARTNLKTTIELVSGDSETINFGNHSFDAVMVAFGVRNFENLETGLAEMLRVLKPGGKLVVLEFSQPVFPGVRHLYQFYMGAVAPQVAKWFRQNKKAYEYLNCSAKAFPDRQRFVNILEKVGYTDTLFKPLSLGICCIYVGRKK